MSFHVIPPFISSRHAVNTISRREGELLSSPSFGFSTLITTHSLYLAFFKASVISVLVFIIFRNIDVD